MLEQLVSMKAVDQARVSLGEIIAIRDRRKAEYDKAQAALNAAHKAMLDQRRKHEDLAAGLDDAVREARRTLIREHADVLVAGGEVVDLERLPDSLAARVTEAQASKQRLDRLNEVLADRRAESETAKAELDEAEDAVKASAAMVMQEDQRMREARLRAAIKEVLEGYSNVTHAAALHIVFQGRRHLLKVDRSTVDFAAAAVAGMGPTVTKWMGALRTISQADFAVAFDALCRDASALLPE